MAEPLLFSFFERFERLGPGDDQTTLKAWKALPPLPEKPRVLDVGAGTGAQTLCLATHTPAHITAVDIHPPFLIILKSRARGIEDRIEVITADMQDLPFPDEAFDVIWSEGAIYNIGFEQGINQWQRLLKPGGGMVLSEVTWLKPDPPAPIKAYWDQAYPLMATATENTQRAMTSNLTCITHFTLPQHAWLDQFYDPIARELDRLEPGTTDQEAAFYQEMRHEIQLYQDYKDWFGYEFYILKKPATR